MKLTKNKAITLWNALAKSQRIIPMPGMMAVDDEQFLTIRRPADPYQLSVSAETLRDIADALESDDIAATPAAGQAEHKEDR